MAWCLRPEFADKFIEGLKSGEINPEELSKMRSEDRHAFLADFVGEDVAKNVNALFEEKLLLKNQQQGMITWAKRVAGLKPEARRDIISRIEKMDKVLDPQEQSTFLKDLASKKLGVDISREEAKQIADFSKEIQIKRTVLKNNPKLPIGSKERLAYGLAKDDLQEYVNDLKTEALKTTLADVKKHPIKGAVRGMANVAGLSKALRATLDNSILLRQGLKTLVTHPGVWLKNSTKSFKDIIETLGGREALKATRAEIISRPNALNGNYGRLKIDIGVTEEAFPTALPEKIPGFGRVYKAAETAFTAWQYRTRADLADLYLNIAERSGVNIKERAEAESIGRMINSLTSRGHLGRFEGEAANTVNKVFWSPRNIKANFDFLTMHMFDKSSSFVKKQAAINLLKTASGIGAVLVSADQVLPGSVEWDTRSSDFGKIKIGDTRFDVTGGMGSLITLGARLITREKKSSVTGKITSLTSGEFGAPTTTDVIYDFFENKLAPAASVIKDLLNNKDFQGNTPTLMGELENAFVPMPITSAIETANTPEAADALLATIADALGVSVNTYASAPESVQDFYKDFYRAQVGYDALDSIVKEEGEQGALEYIHDHPEILKYKEMASADRNLAKLRKMEREVRASSDYSKEEKEGVIEMIRGAQEELANEFTARKAEQ